MWKYIQITLLLLLCGCELFTLRDAEAPKEPAPWNSFFYTPSMTMQNLEYGYKYEENLVKFGELFTGNFRFHFSPQDINDYNINPLWTRDNERDMLYNLHNLADSVKVSLETISGQPDNLQSTPAKMYRKYRIVIQRTNLPDKISEGRMELHLVHDNGFWRIVSWFDYRSDTTPLRPSWGKLKYDFAV